MASENFSGALGVASRIREVRTDLGLNQADFARELGVSRSHISEVENNNVKIPIDLLFLISEKFAKKTKKSNVFWLVSGDTRPVPWGEFPETSRLNYVSGIDTRALITTIRTFERIAYNAIMPKSDEDKALLFKQILYIYVSDVERECQAGKSIEEARRIAEKSCNQLFDISATHALITPDDGAEEAGAAGATRR